MLETPVPPNSGSKPGVGLNPKKDSAGQKPICILPISLEQEYYAGEKLGEIFGAINEACSKVIIILLDTLYVYTLQISGMSEEEAKTKAIEIGKKWEDDAKKYIDEIKIPHEIIKWQTIVSKNEFKTTFALINEKYATGEAHYPLQQNYKLKIKNTKDTLEKRKIQTCRPTLDNDAIALYKITQRTITSFTANSIKKNTGLCDITSKAIQICKFRILEEAAAIAVFEQIKLGDHLAYPLNYNPPNNELLQSLMKIAKIKITANANGDNWHLQLVDVNFFKGCAQLESIEELKKQFSEVSVLANREFLLCANILGQAETEQKLTNELKPETTGLLLKMSGFFKFFKQEINSHKISTDQQKQNHSKATSSQSQNNGVKS